MSAAIHLNVAVVLVVTVIIRSVVDRKAGITAASYGNTYSMSFMRHRCGSSLHLLTGIGTFACGP